MDEQRTSAIPYARAAEEAAAGWLISDWGRNEPKRVLERLLDDDFYNPDCRRVFEEIYRLHLDGKPWSRRTLQSVHQSRLLELAQAGEDAHPPERFVDEIIAAADRRATVRLLSDGLRSLDEGFDVAVVSDHVLAGLGNVGVGREFEDESLSMGDILRRGSKAEPWLIDGMLPRRSRTILVAGEGTGKTIFLRQIAYKAAAGIHPWHDGKLGHGPVRTLIVDLENPEAQMYASVKRIEAGLRHDIPGFDPDSLPIRTVEWNDLNLLTRRGQVKLESQIRASSPELVVLGPIYQSYQRPSMMTDEEAAQTLIEFFDDLRRRYGVTWLFEHHAPHGAMGQRDMRPVGSSLWIRWPEFGRNLTPLKPKAGERKRWVLGSFRGDRIRAPLWPESVTWGTKYPWEATFPTGTFGTLNEDGSDSLAGEAF